MEKEAAELSASSSPPAAPVSEKKSDDDIKDEDTDLNLNDLTMKEMALELMFAGYFTSASAITSCIIELALNPRVFAKLEQELVDYGFINGDLSQDDVDEYDVDSNIINRMKYLDLVVKETLRVRPPVLGAYRSAKKTFQLGVS